MVNMFRELLDAIMKEHSSDVQNAIGEREVRHITRERPDHPTRTLIEKAVLKHMEKVSEKETPRDTAKLRKTTGVVQAGRIYRCKHKPGSKNRGLPERTSPWMN